MPTKDISGQMENKLILDACCGSKMFWFDKNNPNVLFCDNRTESHILCDGRKFEVNPDIECDFTALPFADNSFKLVIFDPPHLIKAGKKSWLAIKYGRLEDNWQQTIKQGFNECMRVLDDYGTLIFKWSERDIGIKEILKIIEEKPLFGHTTRININTHWICFMKFPKNKIMDI